jgi:hypothetical protein
MLEEVHPDKLVTFLEKCNVDLEKMADEGVVCWRKRFYVLLFMQPGVLQTETLMQDPWNKQQAVIFPPGWL